ncbi:MAG: sulfite oxidase heme-binding subunit YedZ [Oligoflexus sp.]
MKVKSKTRQRFIWWLVMLFSLSPLLILVIATVWQALGANPLEALTHWTGHMGLMFLLVSLAITPLQRHFSWRAILPYRRTFGLLAFFYALLHVLLYFGLDHRFDWQLISSDLTKRSYIIAGFLAFIILLVLALTSSGQSMRFIGFKRWKLLHRSVYLAAVLAVIHYLWKEKADWLQPAAYGVVLLLLMLFRLGKKVRRR